VGARSHKKAEGGIGKHRTFKDKDKDEDEDEEDIPL
jgi:hypothetical protein